MADISLYVRLFLIYFQDIVYTLTLVFSWNFKPEVWIAVAGMAPKPATNIQMLTILLKFKAIIWLVNNAFRLNFYLLMLFTVKLFHIYSFHRYIFATFFSIKLQKRRVIKIIFLLNKLKQNKRKGKANLEKKKIAVIK